MGLIKTADMRDILDPYECGEISYSKMVENLNKLIEYKLSLDFVNKGK